MDDRPRLLHRRSEHGYTDRAAEAMSDEPEAVDQATQRLLTAQAGRRAHLRDREQWRQARTDFVRGLTALRGLQGTVDDCRVISRQLDRLERRFGRV
jgi:hypothetical protein